ncbi:MAG: translation elongation factor Ts [Patescibacteria group bacterium]
MKDLIQKLREETGAGIMDCKRAFDEAKGDMVRAKECIKEKGLLKAAKKGERETGAGYLETYVHAGRIGVLLEMRAETDFVTKNEKFRALAHEIAMQIAASAPESKEALYKEPYIKDEKMSVEELVKSAIAEIGENITVAKFTRYEV